MINVLIWLLFGGLAGWATSRVTGTFQEGMPLLPIVAGSLGALIGGVIFLIFDTTPLQVFTLGGLVVALMGAVVILGVVHVMMRRPI